MTPEQADAVEAAATGAGELAWSLSVFFKELLKHGFTRYEALELSREWAQGFFTFRNGGHATEGE